MTANRAALAQVNYSAAVFTFFKYALVIVGAVVTALPFLWMFLTSFKINSDVSAIPMRWLPSAWYPENYLTIWQMMPFARFYLNSVIVGVGQTAGTLLISSMAAYGFARIRFWGRDVIFFLYLGTIMIPGWVTIIPAFTIIRNLGWLNTYAGLIVPGMSSAMGTFLLRQFFRAIPQDLEDAAYVDGANRFQIYWRIIMPLAKPALLTVGLMTFMGSWNNLLWPLIISQSPDMQTLPLGLAQLAIMNGWVRIEWGPLMAATLLSILPIIIIYIFLQQYFIRGITLSGLK